MENKIQCLDHGYVELLNLAGPEPRDRFPDGFDADDIDAARTARMSFDAQDSERSREADLKLSSYLLAHRHTT